MPRVNVASVRKRWNMTTNERTAIEARSLAKRFDNVQAVAGIDFDVRAAFCVVLFVLRLINVRRKWIV